MGKFKTGRTVSPGSLAYAQQVQPQVQVLPGQLSPQLQIVASVVAFEQVHFLMLFSMFFIFLFLKN